MRLRGGIFVGAEFDDRTLEFVDLAGETIVTLAFAIPGEAVPGWEADGEELLLAETGGVRSLLRASWDGALLLQLTVDNLRPEPVELPYLGLGVTVGEGYAGWSWTSDAAGLIAVTSARDARGGVLLRLRQGFLRAARELPVFADEPHEPGGLDAVGRGAFHLSPPGALLGGHRRHSVTLEIDTLDSLSDAVAGLPAWLPGVVVRAGTQIDLSLPDHAVVPGPGVDAMVVDTDVVLTGQPGHREVSVQGRGVDRVRLSWHPALGELLPALVTGLTRRPASRASDAAGYVVVDAVARGLAPDREKALDWLDGVDWLERDSLLGDATAGLAAAVQGEELQLDAAWRLLARRPLSPGYGLVTMRLWLATLSATGEPPALARELLAREAPDDSTDLELCVLRYQGPDEMIGLDGPLAGLIDLLGGPLPGRPVGLPASRAAIAVSLLKLCPEGWSRSEQAAEAASKAEGLLLADYAPPPGEEAALHADLDGLAWLLLGDLGI